MIQYPEIKDHIRVIAFDLGDVLFEGLPANFTYKRIERDWGIKEHTLESLLKPNYEPFEVGEITEDKFWGPVVDKFDLTTELCSAYYRTTVSIIPPTEIYLRSIRKKYCVMTLNNEPKEWMEYRIERFNLDRYFEDYITSGFLGVKKPAPEIYEHFIKRCGEDPKNILFIDNSVTCLEAAEKFGFTTHHFPSVWPPLD